MSHLPEAPWLRSRPLRRACRLAGTVAAWTVIVAISAVVALAVLVPRVGGGTPYTILTSSMRPHLPPGTLVVSRPVSAAEVRIGTVITYQLTSGEPTVVTHRVVAIGADRQGARLFRTQGDANPAPDPAWVKPVQVRGALWYRVPYLGYPSTALTGSQRHSLSLVAALALFGYAGVMVAGGVRDRRRGRAPVPAAGTP